MSPRGEDAGEAERKNRRRLLGEGAVPPHDLDAEAAVLSAVMLDSGRYDAVGGKVAPSDFYSEAHARIWDAIGELMAASKPVDVVQVGGKLKDTQRLAQVGGMAYLLEVLNASPVVAHVEAHAERVRDLARQRRALVALIELAAEGYTDTTDPQAFLDRAEARLSEAARAGVRAGEPVLLRKTLREVFVRIHNGERAMGCTTGLYDLDRMLTVLGYGDLTVLAGRPGMGKSALVMHMAAAVGRATDETGCPTAALVFNLEMPKEQLAMRAMSTAARVDLKALRSGALTDEVTSQIASQGMVLAGSTVYVDDTVGINVLELRARTRALASRLKREGKRLTFVAVDYLQLLQPAERRKQDTREQQVAEMSRALKQLARELRVSIVALSQLSRAVESRGDKRPGLSDLRESGAIEQDADNILFVFRAEYYAEQAGKDVDGEDRGVAEVIVAKQRNGPTGSVRVAFDRRYVAFADLAEERPYR